MQNKICNDYLQNVNITKELLRTLTAQISPMLSSPKRLFFSDFTLLCLTSRLVIFKPTLPNSCITALRDILLNTTITFSIYLLINKL